MYVFVQVWNCNVCVFGGARCYCEATVGLLVCCACAMATEHDAVSMQQLAACTECFCHITGDREQRTHLYQQSTALFFRSKISRWSKDKQCWSEDKKVSKSPEVRTLKCWSKNKKISKSPEVRTLKCWSKDKKVSKSPEVSTLKCWC